MTGWSLDPDENDVHRRHEPLSGGTSMADDENSTMLKVLHARGAVEARPRAVSWALMLCMGIGVVVLFLALVQILR